MGVFIFNTVEVKGVTGRIRIYLVGSSVASIFLAVEINEAKSCSFLKAQ